MSSSGSARRKWTLDEDATFVSCMLELHSTGRYNADSGSKISYMGELERMMEQKLPGCGLKARPHIDSRIRSLKREWRVVYDMKNASGFGWDDMRKMAIAERDVWEAYLKSHPDAAPFRTKSFPYFDELSTMYAKDRATGKDSQSIHEIIMEVETEDSSHREEANFEANSNEQPQHSVGSSSRKKRRRNEFDDKTAIEELGRQMKEIGDKLTKSLSMDTVQEHMLQVNGALSALEGITKEEKRKANRLFAKNPNLVLLFFGCNEDERLEWIRENI